MDFSGLLFGDYCPQRFDNLAVTTLSSMEKEEEMLTYLEVALLGFLGAAAATAFLTYLAARWYWSFQRAVQQLAERRRGK